MDYNQFKIQCKTQFGSRVNIMRDQNSKTLLFSVSSLILNEDLMLIQYFLNYIVTIRQKLPRTLSVPLNIFSVKIVSPNLDFNYIISSPDIDSNHKSYNWIRQNIFQEVSKSCLDNIILKPEMLIVLKEFNVVSDKTYEHVKSVLDNKLNNKKRQVPDYDDYDLDSQKRAKPFQKPSLSTSNDLDVFEHKSISIVKSKLDTTSIDVVKIKWNIRKLADPHIDNTFRIILSNTVNTKMKYHNEGRHTSCLLIYDEEIEKLESIIADTSQSITTLDIEYSKCKNLKESCHINDRINKLKRDYNFWINRYMSLCEARDEVYQLYVSTKHSKLNFSAEQITRNEVEENKIVRQIFGTYQNFYGF